jgi:hypothetical protein
MASDEPPETPTKAARALIGWFAGGLAFESVHAYAEQNSVTAALGYGIGAVVVAIADYKLKVILAGAPRLTRTLNAVASTAWIWVAVAMVSLIVIALSPYIEQQRIPFAAWLPKIPSATEISDDVISKLPKQAPVSVPSAEDVANAVARRFPNLAAAQSPASAPPTAQKPDIPYVNPLHEELTKWRIAASIRTQVLRSDLSADCKITVVRLPVTFAEDYAADFKEIINVAGWKYDEHFATGTIDKGISIRAISSDAPSKRCAQALSMGLRINGRTQTTGNTLRVPEHWLTEAEAPDYLKQCASGCVEVDFGNDDAQ